ncbi:hypothetical protein HRW07_10100 [Streptomyces lunaelactis]|uniref:hypothetical protein n=1 Tax=Streptomyces lunaelactis TaxID=1535768 RepID=UPI00158505C5|nr:hypothetical protein [Streptomyces lunaelactis]NUL03580.1 hypothetical protein [Streptomyces lunaelactis]
MTETTAELRCLLAAVHEALDIPYPATVGDSEAHDRILDERVMHARIALNAVLNKGDDPGWSADYLRARLAELPPTDYRAAGAQPTPADEQLLEEPEFVDLPDGGTLMRTYARPADEEEGQ